MLQQIHSIANAVQQTPFLPRLTQQKADVADAAAAAVSKRRLDEDDAQAMSLNERGGIAALHLMVSTLVAQYGADIVSATAYDLEEEQESLIDDYVNSLLDGLSHGMDDDDDE